VRAEQKTESTIGQSPQEVLAAALAKVLGELNPLPKTTGGVEWLGIEELARRLELKEETARKLAYRGELPPGVLIGGSRRWEWSEVCAFLKARQGLKPRHQGRGRPPKPKITSQPAEVSGVAGG
jgi:hypothetical protein